MTTPLVFKLPSYSLDISKYKSDILITKRINEPLMSYGFHYFVNRTKDYMKITDNLETKNEFYYVVNPFEENINNYEKDINTLSKDFLKKNEPDIQNREFYKIWEILSMFDVAKNNTSAVISDNPTSIIQAILKYRQKYFNSTNDTIYSVSNHEKTKEQKKFMGYYKDSVKPHKTYAQSTSKRYKGKDTGNIKEVKTITNFKNSIDKVDLVIGGTDMKFKNRLYMEQEAYDLIFAEIISALRVQKDGGSFVLRMFSTMTELSNKFLLILCSVYSEVYVYKPFTSRLSDDEKYIICKGFKSGNVTKIIDNMEKVLSQMNTDNFVNDIYTELELPTDFKNTMVYTNIMIGNHQQIMINKIVNYIKSNNYFGEDYHNYREEQIKANKFWTDTFFSDKINNSIITDRVKYNESEIKLFMENLQ